MRTVKAITITIVFCLLTVLTQIGGVAYLLSLAGHPFVNGKISNKYLRPAFKTGIFILIYSLFTFAIVPLLAKPFGRVRLPITKTNNLQPLNVLTCLLNRNYVRLPLRDVAFNIANQMNTRFPGTTVNYLDAGFPFFNKFPLFPHLSHNDGKKMDLAFCYTDSNTGAQSDSAPSFIGYGVSEGPRPGEVNTNDLCTNKGCWQYGLLTKIVPQGNKANFTFDSLRTKALVNICAAQTSIGKIFIEPHLKLRLGLTSDKIRFQGCQAVRHDDHIHIQL